MTAAAIEGGAAGWLCGLLASPHPEVRAAAVFALASFIQARRCPGRGCTVSRTS